MFPSRDELKYAGAELQIQRLADELDQKARPYLLARLAGDIQAVADARRRELFAHIADSVRIDGTGRDTPARTRSE